MTTDSTGAFRFDALTTGNTTLTASAIGYVASIRNVTVNGTNTVAFSLAPSGPRTQFGVGQHRVNTDIAPGRYFADPVDGCYWERLRGFSGAFSDIIANDFLGFDSRQNIVDVLPSDVGFSTNADCRTWFNAPSAGSQAGLPPGMWLVGSQVQPGTYVSTVQSGCYWERLRNFSGSFSDLIANDFIADASQQFVTIQGSDVGVFSDIKCGTWTRTNAVVAPSRQIGDLEANRARYRRR